MKDMKKGALIVTTLLLSSLTNAADDAGAPLVSIVKKDPKKTSNNDVPLVTLSKPDDARLYKRKTAPAAPVANVVHSPPSQSIVAPQQAYTSLPPMPSYGSPAEDTVRHNRERSRVSHKKRKEKTRLRPVSSQNKEQPSSTHRKVSVKTNRIPLEHEVATLPAQEISASAPLNENAPIAAALPAPLVIPNNKVSLPLPEHKTTGLKPSDSTQNTAIDGTSNHNFSLPAGFWNYFSTGIAFLMGGMFFFRRKRRKDSTNFREAPVWED